MRLGEKYNIRWDIAFFQMMLETGNLKFGGDVSSTQNNFAGLGATGKHVPGESFPDIETGVKAHLQHLLLYAGEHLDNPVAERTRKVQEWGVLTDWQKTLKGPVDYAQLAKQWAPTSRRYARDIAGLADTFYGSPCKGADPHPELLALAKPELATAKSKTPVKVAAATAARKLLLTSPQTRRRRNFRVPIWRAAPLMKPADPDRLFDRVSARSRCSLHKMLLRSPSANRRRQIRLRPRSRLSTPRSCRRQSCPRMLRLKRIRAALPTQRPSSRRRKASAKKFRPLPSAPEPSR